MTRSEALHVKRGDTLHCEFFTHPQDVEILAINPNSHSQEEITFQVQAGKHGTIWLDAGWFSKAKNKVNQLTLMRVETASAQGPGWQLSGPNTAHPVAVAPPHPPHPSGTAGSRCGAGM